MSSEVLLHAGTNRNECRMTIYHLPAITRGDLVCWFKSNKTHVCYLLNLVLSQYRLWVL